MMYSPLSGVNGDDKYLAKYNHVVYHFRDLPTDIFVAHIVQEYASSEFDLETTRLLFTLSLNAECSYVEGTLLLLNSPMTFIHYYLSWKVKTAKIRSTSVSQPIQKSACQCIAEVALLKDTIATLQVDVLTLKQQFHVVDRLRADQMKSVTVTLDGIECDLLACSKSIQGCVNITSTQIAASRANYLRGLCKQHRIKGG